MKQSLHTVLGASLVCAAVLCAGRARADGDGYVGAPGVPRPPGFATPGSDASFDKRLPPVLPGEEVSDGKNRMKMWSTSGSVPVAPAPEPWRNDREQERILGSGVGVIVDQRR